MKFKAVYFGHSWFAVNKSEKKNDKIALKSQPQSTYIFLFLHEIMLWVLILMSTHNICFHGEIRKILSRYPSYWSGAMYKYLEEG